MTAIKIKYFEIADSLNELGLTSEILEYAIRTGEYARDSCTKNDPTCAPGFVAWSKTVRALRDALIPKGWEKCDDYNFPTVVSPNKKIAISVSTGNEATGNATAEPKTKYAKGEAARSAVKINQGVLFPEMNADKVAAQRITWILLKRRVGDTVVAELSLPALMTTEGQIVKWETRIILNAILIDPDFDVQDDSSSEEIDVPVLRRKTN